MKKLFILLFLLPLFSFAQTKIELSEALHTLNDKTISTDFSDYNLNTLSLISGYESAITTLYIDDYNWTVDFLQVTTTDMDTTKLSLIITEITLHMDTTATTYSFYDSTSSEKGFIFTKNEIVVFYMENSYLPEKYIGFMGIKQ